MAQGYEVYIDSAYSAFDRKDYLAAALYYDSVLYSKQATRDDFYDAAGAYSLSNQKEKAIRSLDVAFATGYSNFTWMYHDKGLDNLRKEEAYLLLERKYRPDSVLFFGDILALLSSQQKTVLRNKKISLIPADADYSLEDIKNRWNYDVNDSALDFSDKSLVFDNCTFVDGDQLLPFLKLRSLVLGNNKGKNSDLELSALDLKDLFIVANELNLIELRGLKLNGVFQFWHNNIKVISVNDSNLDVATRKNDGDLRPVAVNDRGFYQVGFHVHEEAENVSIRNTVIRQVNSEMPVLAFSVNTKNMTMLGSVIDYDLLVAGHASDGLNAAGNRFVKNIDFTGFRFPELNCYIPFAQFESRIVKIESPQEGVFTIWGDSLSHFADSELLDRLVYVYKYLHNNYRARGELTSANACYVAMKELEIAHLKYKKSRTTEETVRLRLNQLMGVYTDYGTSPGKALIISFRIMICFAIFYFFFPSEWDKETKAKLIADFRLFVEKNEHGYFRPFLTLVKRFLISFINALTLSANAFVTLGFGNIPTVGVARYVCVFQGVLGWLLLSLFSVALINEILL